MTTPFQAVKKFINRQEGERLSVFKKHDRLSRAVGFTTERAKVLKEMRTKYEKTIARTEDEIKQLFEEKLKSITYEMEIEQMNKEIVLFENWLDKDSSHIIQPNVDKPIILKP